MNKNIVIIQARLGSTRLPYKMMLSLHGKPIIEWVIKRVQRSTLLDDMIVVIPQSEDNDVLGKYIKEMGIKVFRGSEENVLERLYKAVEKNPPKNIIRVCADNPLIDGNEIDNLIKFYQENSCDYAYNHIPKDNMYPDGLGAEIISFDMLKYLYETVKLQHHKEHCLSYITDNKDKFTIKTFDPPKTELHHPEMKFDVDTFNDYQKLSMRSFDIDITSEDLIMLFSKNRQYKFKNNKFDDWNNVKKELDNNKKVLGFREQDILFLSIGKNIGFETYGKKEYFLRPVLVIKKLGTYSFIGIPLTKTQRDGNYFYNFEYTQKIKSSAMLNQIRTFDIKRAKYKSEKISNKDFEEIKKRIIQPIEKLPHSEEGEHTKVKISTTIPNNNKNVKEIKK